MSDISIVIPIHNGEKWINKCMESIAAQTVFGTELKVEIVVCNDGSKDRTKTLLANWAEHFKKSDVAFIVTEFFISKGVGAAKNSAISKSSGRFLCFQDIDDVMHPNRILSQYRIGELDHTAIIGSKIRRDPEYSTPRLVNWVNNLSPTQLKLQIYTSNGPTLLMPTWFCHRSVYERVGGFNESGKGTPEDLIFFYAHLDAGGNLHRINEELVIYTYHEGAATFSVKRESIWNIQLHRLEKYVLPQWKNFTVWNAGKAGRRVVRALSLENRKKVSAFCDVDVNKIGRTIELYSPSHRTVESKLPVVHYSEAKPPLLICVKLDLTNGEFENNLKSLNLIEGIDYIIFN